MTLRPAAFLDRDGVINADYGYVGDPDKLVLLPHAAQGLKLLKDLGYLLLVVTNQSGIARGYYTEEDVHKVHQKMNQLLSEKTGVVPDAYFYCPHHINGELEVYRVDCDCRKPKPGLIDQALAAFKVDISGSFLVGDKESDILAGRARNLTSYQIENSNYPMTELSTRSFTDLLELAQFRQKQKKVS